jgi:hypothetical protein
MIDPRYTLSPGINSRYMFGWLLSRMGITGEAVEVGVANGDFSFSLLNTWDGKVHMVDCWANQDPAEYRDSFNTNDAEQAARYQGVLQKAARYDGRAVVHRLYSHQAAPLFADGQLSFVYLDGNHCLEAIRQDIALWWPKLRVGGIFAGHDYLDGKLPSGDYGVMTAVNELATEHGVVVNVVPEEWPSWWVAKT